MNENNGLKFHSIEFFLRCLNINFGDQNKKQTAQNKIRTLKMGKKKLPNIWLSFNNIQKTLISILTIRNNFF